MSFRMRPFDPATDYPGMVAVTNVTFPREPTDVAAMAQRDANRPPDCHFAGGSCWPTGKSSGWARLPKRFR